MTDLQFKSRLKGIGKDLEEIRKKASEPEAIEKLDEMMQRFRSGIGS